MIARSGYLLLPFPNPEFLFPAPGQHDPPLLFVGPVQDRDVADALHEHRIGAGGQLFDERVAGLAVRGGDLHLDQFVVLKGACRSEEHTSELQSLMRISYAVFCLKKKNIPPSATTSKR